MCHQFSADFPPDCPPADATVASGPVYRLVHQSPASDLDFQTHAETGKLPKAPPCLRSGLSVLRQLADAQHQRRLFPQLGRWIARAHLETHHGQTKLTPGKVPDHTTWWPYRDLNRAALFTIVSEEI